MVSDDTSPEPAPSVGLTCFIMSVAVFHGTRKLIDEGEARQYVSDLLNVGRSTLYRALNS